MYEFSGSSMTLTFHSDNWKESGGFHVRVIQQIYPMFISSPQICEFGDNSESCMKPLTVSSQCTHTPSFGIPQPTNRPQLSGSFPFNGGSSENDFNFPENPISFASPSCSIILRAMTATMTSPDYPGFYPNNFSCTYRIMKMNASICQLLIKVLTYL